MDPTEIIDPQILQKEQQQVEKNLQNSQEPDRLQRLKDLQENML